MNPAYVIGAILSGLGVAIMLDAKKKGAAKSDNLTADEKTGQSTGEPRKGNPKGPDGESNSGDDSGRAGNADSVESGSAPATDAAAAADAAGDADILNGVDNDVPDEK